MTTFADIREGLAIAVETTGLQCDAYITEQVNAPVAQVTRREMNPDLVFGQTTQIALLAIVVYAGKTSEVDAQKLLDAYCDRDGELSIKAAIEDGDNWATSLGVDYCKLLSWGEPLVRSVAGVDYLTVELDVEVCW